jgi:DNA-binding response OmpR family regulator
MTQDALKLAPTSRPFAAVRFGRTTRKAVIAPGGGLTFPCFLFSRLETTRRSDTFRPPFYERSAGPIPFDPREHRTMTARKILIVDDDADLRDALVEQLSLYEEFEPLQAESATDGVKAARTAHADLVLMDVGLPDMDGREAVKILRKGGFASPIIMLTGHDTDSDQILGLEAGANDYVTKPFKFAVLLARLRAQLRQHEQSEEAVFTIGPYTFRPSAKLLVDGKGSKVRLTEKETSILKFLYRAGEKVVTRDVLLHEVWGYNAGITTHTLETHIYRLRQKIEKDPSNAQLLVTEGGGYKLVP